MKNLKILFLASALTFLAGSLSAQTSTVNQNLNTENSVDQKLAKEKEMLFEANQMYALERERRIKTSSSTDAYYERPGRIRWIEGEMMPDELTEVKPVSN